MKSIKHFVFWLKTITAIELCIFDFILRYVMIKDRQSTYVNIFGDIFFYVVIVLIVINFSGIDGHHAINRFKIVLGMVISMYFTIVTIQVSLFYDEDIMQSMVIIGGLQFSIASLYAGALRILTIFLWKQTILMMVKRDRCVNIRHSPRIKWVDDDKQ